MANQAPIQPVLLCSQNSLPSTADVQPYRRNRIQYMSTPHDTQSSPRSLVPLIYVINLPEAEHRRKHVENLLSNASLDYTIIAGIKGSDLSQDEISQCYDKGANARHYRRALSIGEIGCYLSHRRCWEQLLSSEHSWAVILEDDIEIKGDFSTLINLIPSKVNADIIKLSDDSNCKVIDSKALAPSFEWVNYKRIPNCANGYIITRQGAKKLLAKTKVYRPVDIDMQFFKELDLKVCGIRPYCIWPAIFESHIDAQGKGGSRKTFTWPWRNWRYRLELFWLRTKLSMNIETVDQ